MRGLLCEYYRCPERYIAFAATGLPSSRQGFFKLRGNVLYGSVSTDALADSPADAMCDAAMDIGIDHGQVHLPFDPIEVVENLRLEKYAKVFDQRRVNSLVGRAYYFVRPFLPIRVRRRLQKLRLREWHQIPFPRWPVDRTVDKVMADLLRLCRQAHGVEQIPFIWFWPEGATSAAVVTHDVETASGRDRCSTIMDIDDSFGIKASFEVVPEKRYQVKAAYIDSIWERGFEVAVHDLNHDGLLYSDRDTFLKRVATINEYRRSFGAQGFRAAVLYRNQEWYEALDFLYDTSVPSVGHLDPQRGGCCTVMPYFIGKLVELPVTLTQDYSLFHILNDYSIDLWRRQIELIMESNGLINVIIHPDYSTTPRERAVFELLLAHLAKLRSEKRIWTALPKDVARWWRQRSEMRLIEDETGLRIEGEGKERARIAYASEHDGRLVFEVASSETVSLAGRKH